MRTGEADWRIGEERPFPPHFYKSFETCNFCSVATHDHHTKVVIWGGDEQKAGESPAVRPSVTRLRRNICVGFIYNFWDVVEYANQHGDIDYMGFISDCPGPCTLRMVVHTDFIHSRDMYLGYNL